MPVAVRSAVLATLCILTVSVAVAQDHPASTTIPESIFRSQGDECFLFANECAVASIGRWPSNFPYHFHSNDTLEFPAETTDFAEVGECCSQMAPHEEVRGMGEFDMSGLGALADVTLGVQVIQLGGLYSQPATTFSVQVVAYAGNNAEEIPDYTAGITYSLGTFSTGGLSVGDWLEFDITEAYNASVGSTALGVRLQASSNPAAGALVFGNFELCEGVIPVELESFEIER